MSLHTAVTSVCAWEGFWYLELQTQSCAAWESVKYFVILPGASEVSPVMQPSHNLRWRQCTFHTRGDQLRLCVRTPVYKEAFVSVQRYLHCYKKGENLAGPFGFILKERVDNDACFNACLTSLWLYSNTPRLFACRIPHLTLFPWSSFNSRQSKRLCITETIEEARIKKKNHCCTIIDGEWINSSIWLREWASGKLPYRASYYKVTSEFNLY